MLGFPDSLYGELFGQPRGLVGRKALNHPLGFSTPLYRECEIAQKLQLTLENYRKLSRKERKIWYYHTILANEKERHQYEKVKQEQDMKRNQAPSMPHPQQPRNRYPR